jgi:2-C-methyl-D-erythritol 4-phosphate cytidylyltransferase
MFFKRRQPPVYTAAVITAAGHSSRMQGIDKVFAPLGGVPVLVHSLMAFERCARIHEIVAVVREECIPEVLELSREFGVTKLRSIVKGGPSRQQSVYAGVLACSEEARLICIHDGARPLVDERVICGALDAAEHFDAATACVALKETVKFSRAVFARERPTAAQWSRCRRRRCFRANCIWPLIARQKKSIRTTASLGRPWGTGWRWPTGITPTSS